MQKLDRQTGDMVKSGFISGSQIPRGRISPDMKIWRYFGRVRIWYLVQSQ